MNPLTRKKAGKKHYLHGWAVAVLLVLSACLNTTPTPESSESAFPPSSDASSVDEGDLVGDLILDIENRNQSSSEQAQKSPKEKERDLLAEQALNAALGLLKTKQRELPKPTEPFNLSGKSDDKLRIGILLPLSGNYARLGQDIAGGVEMALFQARDPDIDIVFFDTVGGDQAEEAARQAVAAQVDIIVGPLFTRTVHQIRPILANSGIPTLALSNNIGSAAPGNWVLGYLPEQQIDHLLGFAVSQNKTRVAILASEDPFGQQILNHAVLRLSELGLPPVRTTVLTPDVLSDEDSLKQAIKAFSQYTKPASESAPSRSAAYDVLILAGDSDFVLRTAPVLAFYDVAPPRVTYLGTDLWARADLVSEPSLQGSVVVQAALPESAGFEKQWQTTFSRPANTLGRLGFDAFALIVITKQEMARSAAQIQPSAIDWRTDLNREQGFAGYSGQFKLLPDGRNQRQYQLHVIDDNQIKPMDI